MAGERTSRGTVNGLAPHAEQFASDVAYYLTLTPRQLPSRYLYDDLGSSLFEAICHLPWYRVTRAEKRLLRTCGAHVLTALAPLSKIIELGAGSGEKLRILLDHRRSKTSTLNVHLVDVSSSALDTAARSIASAGNVRVTTHQGSYEDGLRVAAATPAGAGGTAVVFLGSNIGNYDRPGANAFVHGVRSVLQSGDAFLVGADLVKPERELLLAYDDPLGVTGAFNRNLLLRINRELGGNFDLTAFSHEAIWNPQESRIEMHLVAHSTQQVRIAAAQLDFIMETGERIWTESSYKYRVEDIAGLLEPAGFRIAHQWVDEQDGFALTLGEAL